MARTMKIQKAVKVQERATGLDEGRLKELVAQKAYQLWEKNGCCHGQDMDHWLEAERLVERELKSGS